MTTQLAFTFGAGTHQNHFLFSDHYLNELLPRQDAWQQHAGTRPFLQWLHALYQQEKANLPHYNEAQLEENWIRPIFNQLGWEGMAETQATIPALAEANIRKPDYVFFPTVAARQAAAGQQNTASYTETAVSVGEAKRWTASLNKKVRGGAPNFDNNNPSYQIDYYLRAADVEWGILTNGRLWRLVHKATSYKLDVYFEIDLETAVSQEQITALHYFTRFFGQASFVEDENGRVFLSDALNESIRYAHELENDLRDNAYKALEQIISGYFAFDRNQLDPQNPDHLQQVYTNSLYLLYRLLFLLYGESRGLLPLRNPQYKAVSLTTLVEETDPKQSQTKEWSPYMRQIWIRVSDLCHVINGSDPAMNAAMGVPRYNGGLFNPDLHPFLEKKMLGDSYLVQAIDYLARRDSHKQGDYAVKEPVDYRTLGVRQLGSIYEGLLEYTPRAASEPMVTIRRKGREMWVAASERGRAKPLERREVGELYLATDKGERKATGSYYTPDYIVKYIVEQTLDPLIEAARARVKGAANGGDEVAHAQRFVDEILALNVLDPAMGSGHFLVEATDHLARALATDEWVQAESGSDDAEADLVYWRRRVVEACIYGVDKNRMAVELAKLSLWLVTVAKDKPLSFLDHHLRHGDSLVGARLADLVALPRLGRFSKPAKSDPANAEAQLPLLNETMLTQDLFRAVGGMGTIETMLSETLDDVYAKEQIYGDLRRQLDGWRRLANLWTSSFFGNEMSPEEYRELARHLQGEPTALSAAQLAPFLDHPASDSDYFHWELAFPEIFFDPYGQPLGDRAGFDAVIGNPPYIRIQVLVQTDVNLVNYLNNIYECGQGNYDIYSLFVEQGGEMMRHSKGRLGFILPHKFFQANYGEGLRAWLAKRKLVSQLVDFGANQVFEDATTYTCLLFLDSKPHEYFYYSHIASLSDEFAANLAYEQISLDELDLAVWAFDNYQVVKIWNRLKQNSQPLARICKRIYQGLKTSADSVYIFEEREVLGDHIEVYSHQTNQVHTMEKSLLHPLIKGGDVERFCIKGTKRLVLFPYFISDGLPSELISEDVLKSDYPNAYAYLLEVKSYLERRERGRFVGEHWYQYGRNQAVDVITYPKIFTPDIAPKASYVLDLSGTYLFTGGTAGGYGISLPENLSAYFLLGVLNSTLLDSFLKSKSTVFRGNWYSFESRFIRDLPIANIHFATENISRNISLSSAQNYYRESDFSSTITWTVAELSDDRTDTVHDLIAFLSKELLDMNSKKLGIEQRFWLDMEGVAGEAWPKLQKGKWEESLHKKVAATRPFVRLDSRSTRTLEESLGWNEAAFRGFVRLLLGKVRGLAAMVDVYNSYHADYAALVQRIAATDALIDQIVYKLYGLTEAEIEIVEGR